MMILSGFIVSIQCGISGREGQMRGVGVPLISIMAVWIWPTRVPGRREVSMGCGLRMLYSIFQGTNGVPGPGSVS